MLTYKQCFIREGINFNRKEVATVQHTLEVTDDITQPLLEPMIRKSLPEPACKTRPEEDEARQEA